MTLVCDIYKCIPHKHLSVLVSVYKHQVACTRHHLVDVLGYLFVLVSSAESDPIKTTTAILRSVYNYHLEKCTKNARISYFRKMHNINNVTDDTT